jgi:hypothetical protein
MAAFPIGIRIEEHEYGDFLRAIPNDKHLPATHDEWLKRRLTESQELLKKGGRLNEVLVDYKGFAKYCRDRKQKPSYVVLMAYAVTKSIE